MHTYKSQYMCLHLPTCTNDAPHLRLLPAGCALTVCPTLTHNNAHTTVHMRLSRPHLVLLKAL
jgi:hypothetical protein